MGSIANRSETERLAALDRYSALDLDADPTVCGITGLAAQLLGVPFATLSFVDHEAIRFKSRHGFDTESIERTPGLCDASIVSSAIYHVADATKNSVTDTNPLVTGSFGLRFYAAAPLRTPDGFNIGTLCAIDQKPRHLSDEEGAILAKLASVVMSQLEFELTVNKVAQLEHKQHLLHGELQQANVALAESEERFRDLFEEAPIAYVHEDLDSRFIRANHTALEILGLKPEEAIGMVGKTLVADTPDTQIQLEGAFESIARGTNTSGVILEMRRKDNGAPVWIQWWSRPAPDGSFTRTMFIDVTDLVEAHKQKKKLEAQNLYLQEEIRGPHFAKIVGTTAQMRDVFADIEQVAPTTATVLILGETGTGKELIARAVHKISKRSDMPLIKVNCSALPASLIESELFGHEKGAFTGATAKRAGRFALADGGSIFLDEIGDLPIDLQAKLLRVLQEGEFEPLGSSVTMKVDVRVIAATNRDLLEAIQGGEFREDLYFRLAVFPLSLPPLRDRLDDVPALANLFARKYAGELGQEPLALLEADMQRLRSYTWPGNVRELQNVIERALITSQDGVLNLDRALPESAPDSAIDSAGQDLGKLMTSEQLQQLERDNLHMALETTSWQVAGKGGAAELLGMNPTTLGSRMKALGIRRPH